MRPTFVLALLVVPVLGSLAATQSRPTFHAETRLIVLHASVTNGRGELITNLDRDAFTVYENGKLQPIALFRRDDVPVSLGILIDNSGSMKRKRPKVEEAALAFVRASNPQDEVFVMNFADEPHVDVPMTTDLDLVKAGVARVDAIGGTALRDAVDAAFQYLAAHATRDRKALLVITDGNDNASATPVSRIRQAAERDEIIVEAIGLLNDADQSSANRARRELEDLTEMTGGLALFPERLDDIDRSVLDVAHRLRAQYTIAYTPLNGALDGSYRAIRLVAKGPERLTVRTRAGYRASPEPTSPPPPSSSPKPASRP